MIYSILELKYIEMAKGKKSVNETHERQDLFAIAKAGFSHPSDTNHGEIFSKKIKKKEKKKKS
jgi:hypothetical protein